MPKARAPIGDDLQTVEMVFFDPKNEDTFPSVCFDAMEVFHRFGFVGGEKLLFDLNGNYVGQLIKEFDGG